MIANDGSNKEMGRQQDQRSIWMNDNDYLSNKSKSIESCEIVIGILISRQL